MRILYDKANNYKIKHADAWKIEDKDTNKRIFRMENLVELFKISELLKCYARDQLAYTPPK